MATFALIHGAWHGAWCFEHVAALLEGEGARAIAVELPGDDPDAGLDDYVNVAVEALGDVEGDVVVVGHSLGGMVIPLVADRRPVSKLVFLAAFVPTPGVSMNEQLEAAPDAFAPGAREGRELDGLGRSYWADPQQAIALLYPDCDPAEAELAVARLRPQGQRPASEPCPLATLPAVESAYIICRDDRMSGADYATRTARERLGVEPIELPGGHSPFLSRPGHLCSALLALARAP